MSKIADAIKVRYQKKIAKKQREIEELRTEMEQVLLAIANLKHFEDEELEKTEVVQESLFAKSSQPKRIEAALERMPQEFTRNELYVAANSDGGKQIPLGSFGWYFAEMIKNNLIELAEKTPGGKPNKYKKVRNPKGQP